MDRAARRQQAKNDEKILAHGIDAADEDPAQTVALARQLYALFDRAKRDGDIAPPVRLLHAKIGATQKHAKKLALACAKGCSHCCKSWVSVPAPEILFIARRVRESAPLRERVAAAYGATKPMDAAQRLRVPVPCPMLESDLCTIYEIRPMVCRFAASADEAACRSVFLYGSGGSIPTPLQNLKARGSYVFALSLALRNAGFSHHFYEFNAALARALERADCERAWLSGEDIFDGLPRDPTDILGHAQAPYLFRQAFGG
jgi:Fe-S-cluster containining protein